MPRQYKLTDGDQAVIRKAAETGNPNWFFNHFLRSPYSGTYWRPVTNHELNRLEFVEFRDQAMKWKVGYEKLYDVWGKLGQPEYFAPIEGKWLALSEEQYRDMLDGLDAHYRVIFDVKHPEPVFHHNHGYLLLPWALEMNNTPQEERVIVGGYGSSKTFSCSLRLLYHAATLRGYRGFAMAPNSIQSDEFYSIIQNILTDTLYMDKFVVRLKTRPRPTVVISHDHIGTSTIECIPVAKEPDKALTVTGDEVVIDQCEKFDGGMLQKLRRSMGTRFRGTMFGRTKVGTSIYLANSGDNDEFWALFDEAKTKPEDVWAFSPPTVLNIYLSVADLIRFERRVGDDEESKAMYLRGQRPMGSGEHFSAVTLRKIRDNDLTMMIKTRSTEPVPDILEDQQDPTEGFVWKEDPKLGCYYFTTPYNPDRQYLVASDAGWNDPPKRDTAVVGVFDYTDFPYVPATLVGLSWVFGGHSPDPFLAQHTDFTLSYKAISMNAFDATAQQSGYETFLQDLMPTPVNMGGNAKFRLLTFVKTLASRGLLRMPYVSPLFSQMVRYKLPDKDIVQDMVAMLLVAGFLLEPLYYAVYGEEGEEEESDPQYLGDQRDRYSRPLSPRYTGHRR